MLAGKLAPYVSIERDSTGNAQQLNYCKASPRIKVVSLLDSSEGHGYVIDKLVVKHTKKMNVDRWLLWINDHLMDFYLSDRLPELTEKHETPMEYYALVCWFLLEPVFKPTLSKKHLLKLFDTGMTIYPAEGRSPYDEPRAFADTTVFIDRT